MRQFAVIGLGRFGLSVAKTLSQKGCQVLAIDIDEDRVQDFSEFASQAVCADATDEKALKTIGIESADVAVISVGNNLEASILITLALKEIGIKEIIAKAVSEDQGKVLSKIGATKIVFPERDMGIRLANALTSPLVSEHIVLSDDSSIIEIAAPFEFTGKTLKQLSLRIKYGLTVVAIKSKDPSGKEIVDPIPQAEYKIKQDDKLLVVGKNDDLDKLKKER